MRKKGCASAPRARHPLPVHRIVRRVGVDQRVPEPLLADAPVGEQVLDQKRGGDHARPVVHPAGRPQLAHAGIDDRIAGAPAPPRPDVVGIGLGPGEIVEGRLQIARGEVGMVVEEMPGEFPPGEFRQELVRAAPAGVPAIGVPDLTGADLAEAQMRREARGGVGRRPVAIRAVARRGDRRRRQALPPRPVRPAARLRRCRRRPVVPRRKQAEGFEAVAGDGDAGGNVRRRGQGVPGVRRLLESAPEGREDLERAAGAVRIASGGNRRLASKVRADDAGSRHRRDDPFVERGRRAIAPVPVDGGGAAGAGDLRHDLLGGAAAQDEDLAAGPQTRCRGWPANGAATSAPRRRAGECPGFPRHGHRAGQSAHRAGRRRPAPDCRPASDRRETRRASGPGRRIWTIRPGWCPQARGATDKCDCR